MEAICSAEDEQEEALLEVKRRITRYKRACQKYQLYQQPEEEIELVRYIPAEEESAPAGATGGRPRLATIHVDCDDCEGHEVVVKGGEGEHANKRKQQDKLYCEH